MEDFNARKKAMKYIEKDLAHMVEHRPHRTYHVVMGNKLAEGGQPNWTPPTSQQLQQQQQSQQPAGPMQQQPIPPAQPIPPVTSIPATNTTNPNAPASNAGAGKTSYRKGGMVKNHHERRR
jgi:hypothetical protein